MFYIFVLFCGCSSNQTQKDIEKSMENKEATDGVEEFEFPDFGMVETELDY